MYLPTGRWANSVSVVVVTFNSADVIRRALCSVPVGAELIVVDNASTDNSLALAEAEGARCIRQRKNTGFGRACNIGAAASSRELILFLNPDAVLNEGALEAMAAAAHRYPEAGAIGPMLIDGDGNSIWRFSSILHPMGHAGQPVEPEAACCVPLLTGAALLCRRVAFEEVGGFDENIFLYHEDDDLCLRLTNNGWPLIYEPTAQTYHVFGQSCRLSKDMIRFKSEQRLLSHAYVARKYDLKFDLEHEWRRAIKRLLLSLITFDRRRRAAALGRIDALHALQSARKAFSGADTVAEFSWPCRDSVGHERRPRRLWGLTRRALTNQSAREKTASRAPSRERRLFPD